MTVAYIENMTIGRTIENKIEQIPGYISMTI